MRQRYRRLECGKFVKANFELTRHQRERRKEFAIITCGSLQSFLDASRIRAFTVTYDLEHFAHVIDLAWIMTCVGAIERAIGWSFFEFVKDGFPS